MAKIRFPIEMADGVLARNLDDMKENFDIERVIGYFLDGKLFTWLNDRYYDDESEKVSQLSADDNDLGKKLCEIFCVEYKAENIVNTQEIALKNERITRLKQFTDDEEIINSIDLVAFNQEELADLYDSGVEKIYLCEGEFNIPKSKQDLEYVEIGGAKVSGKKERIKTTENSIEKSVDISTNGIRKHGNGDTSKVDTRKNAKKLEEIYLSEETDLKIESYYDISGVGCGFVTNNGKNQVVHVLIGTQDISIISLDCEDEIKIIYADKDKIFWSINSESYYLKQYDCDECDELCSGLDEFHIGTVHENRFFYQKKGNLFEVNLENFIEKMILKGVISVKFIGNAIYYISENKNSDDSSFTFFKWDLETEKSESMCNTQISEYDCCVYDFDVQPPFCGGPLKLAWIEIDFVKPCYGVYVFMNANIKKITGGSLQKYHDYEGKINIFLDEVTYKLKKDDKKTKYEKYNVNGRLTGLPSSSVLLDDIVFEAQDELGSYLRTVEYRS